MKSHESHFSICMSELISWDRQLDSIIVHFFTHSFTKALVSIAAKMNNYLKLRNLSNKGIESVFLTSFNFKANDNISDSMRTNNGEILNVKTANQ